jgi:hypothetical protein
MTSLLSSLVLALCLQNLLQCGRNLDFLISLQMIVDHLETPVDVGPFTKFIMALVESGRLRDLLMLCTVHPGFLTKISSLAETTTVGSYVVTQLSGSAPYSACGVG